MGRDQQIADEIAEVARRRMQCEKQLAHGPAAERLEQAQLYVRLIREEVHLFNQIAANVPVGS